MITIPHCIVVKWGTTDHDEQVPPKIVTAATDEFSLPIHHQVQDGFLASSRG
jgi:hypothetical protein